MDVVTVDCRVSMCTKLTVLNIEDISFQTVPTEFKATPAPAVPNLRQLCMPSVVRQNSV